MVSVPPFIQVETPWSKKVVLGTVETRIVGRNVHLVSGILTGVSKEHTERRQSSERSQGFLLVPCTLNRRCRCLDLPAPVITIS